MSMTKLKDIIASLETWANPSLQESYDNSGLITGNHEQSISKVLISLDCTETIVDEAIEKNCELIIAHHPIVFKGLKRLTGANYVEKTIIKAIKNDISIYAIHTNLDNVNTGVNKKICEKIGLNNLQILDKKRGKLEKLTTFIPIENTDSVLAGIYKAGGGEIGNYSGCSFRVAGTGTFTPNNKANPTIGNQNNPEEVAENRVEIMYPSYLQSSILNTLKQAHPYEEVAYYIQQLENKHQEIGSGMIGILEQPMDEQEFLNHLKKAMNLELIKFTPLAKKIKKVAVCGGAGSFLLHKAKSAGADAFVTSDFKYHEFFDAENQIMIADIGHYESEIFTKDLIYEYLTQKFSNIAAYLTEVSTNPIKYFK
jgi:dinuclear metal center YbgI/SA1388 family protein